MLKGSDWSFIHVPKCGGMAIRKFATGAEIGAYLPLGNQAAIYSPLHRMPLRRPSGRVCAVVRHPAAWLRSYWLDQAPHKINTKRYLHKFWADDVNEFVCNVCNHIPGYVGRLYSAHIRYDDVKVFRLEDGLEKVLKWLGVECDEVPMVNASPSHPQLNGYSYGKVAYAEWDALVRFGYAL